MATGNVAQRHAFARRKTPRVPRNPPIVTGASIDDVERAIDDGAAS